MDGDFSTSTASLEHVVSDGPRVSLPPPTPNEPSSSSSSSADSPSSPIAIDKGKGVSRAARGALEEDEEHADLFSMSFDSEAGFTHPTVTSPDASSPFTSHDPDFGSYHPTHDISMSMSLQDDDLPFTTTSDKGKGKGRDLPPTLPPLTFSPTEFSYDDMYGSGSPSTFSSSNDPGPSSFGSIYTTATTTGQDPSPVETTTAQSQSPVTPSPAQAQDNTPNPMPVLIRMPSRRRSLSNLSMHSTHSVAARSVSRVRMRLTSVSANTRGPSTLARKLFKRGDQSPSSAITTNSPTPSPSATPSPSPYVDGRFDFDFDSIQACEVGCFTPWRRRSDRDRDGGHSNSPSPSSSIPNCFNVDIEQIMAQELPVAESYYPPIQTHPSSQSTSTSISTSQVQRHIPRPTRESAFPLNLKGKGRSYSSPFPLVSALDLVPLSPSLTHSDVFVPLPLALTFPVKAVAVEQESKPRNAFEEKPEKLRSAFEEMLPREVRLHVFACLVHGREEEHVRRMGEGRWTVHKAGSSKNRWVGREQGVRELVRMSRVCKSWMGLVFDGQLWTDLDVRPFPKMPPSQIMHIAKSAGPFIKTLSLAGHTSFLPSSLQTLTDSLSLRSTTANNTLLTSVDLTGCSSLTTPALHHLLRRSPLLNVLKLRALNAVTNETCEIIYESCKVLEVLDMSRCKLISGAGIRSMAAFALRDQKALKLRELRLSGLKGITDGMMESLGRVAPGIEVLDLSYCKDLHNSSIEAFTACPLDMSDMVDVLDPEMETVVLSAREAGREYDSNGYAANRYRRRVTRLRHLSLSSCGLLTDIACSHLAYAMPRLEMLELGGIGAEMKDEGLVRLLETLPGIRKVDLEDASEITDKVLEALTPSRSHGEEDDGEEEREEEGEGEPGSKLEHLVVSYAVHLSNEAFLALITNCHHLKVLEADSTRLSGPTLKTFVNRARERSIRDATVVAIDCRSVGEGVLKELAGEDKVRARKGQRKFETRKLGYLDGRDDEGLGVGMDECDEGRVVVKTFYSWQSVDAVTAARAKRKRTRKAALGGRDRDRDTDLETDAVGDEEGGSGLGTGIGGGGSRGIGAAGLGAGRARWWSPGGGNGRLRGSAGGANTPSLLDLHNERDGCTIM
ncbi:RNI-like protein [Stereum hirsutum FP-91666 SS1]|uniref:RNI-like protein n=1 Tax=Stereum hirsutum (strain FP-91666) TaxID=721885 RepID=UPI000444A586|nr:RNI-like protein [Stereum hirsutum FP-91666 SS1]EIM83620.1 RNI-like protein [Stereum hirsutum FP-91666 SS1]